MTIGPVLSEPPAFVLLALAVGVSGYLREVSRNREKEMDEIEDGMCDTKFPHDSPQRKERLEYLEVSRKRLSRVATFVIALVIFIAGRLLVMAIMRFVNRGDPNWLEYSYRAADLLIMASLFILFVGLGYMHSIGKRKTDRIRLMIATWKAAQESATQPAVRTSSKTRKATQSKTVLEIPESNS